MPRTGTGVARHLFVPETVWVDGADGWLVPLRRADDPERWARLCASDEPIIIQVDDGRDDGERGCVPTSSSSAPPLMREMIGMLGVEPGMSVLEIGTGTGYNAALLAEVAGAENVTTVEVDPSVADHAREALRRAGLPVTVVTGDGAAGCPDNAPYDRVIATAAVQHVPSAWVAQCRPGGRVVVPWASAFASGGALLTLTVGADGTAEGRFGREVAFMYLRGHRPEHVWWGDDEERGDYVRRPADSCLREPFDLDSDARFTVGVRLPGCGTGETVNADGTHTLRVSHPESGSWAACAVEGGGHVVRQHGPRRLWDELEAAYRWWLDAGRPSSERFGMTVTRGGQRVWLDSPD